MESGMAPTLQEASAKNSQESYGYLRYVHKENEKGFVAWVTARSAYIQQLKGRLWLKTLEREFYEIKEHLPLSLVDELVAIVDAREKAKIIHLASGTHNQGHENCIQMYKGFLRRVDQQMTPPTTPPPSSSPSSSLPPPPPPPPPRRPTSEDDFPPIGSPKALSPARRVSTKRLFSAISPGPSGPTLPAVLRTGSVKRQRLVLKPRSACLARCDIAAC